MSKLTSAELDAFVNDVEPNVDYTKEKRNRGEDWHDFYMRLEAKFKTLITFDRDDEYIKCQPVVIYTLKHKVVAWYDYEMQIGYIA